MRRIQHFLYCSHRWGLCEIEQLWSDNQFVAQADLMHERVHDPNYIRTGRGIRTYCGVSVFHDGSEYGLYGVTDCIEARPNPAGVTIPGEDGRYQLCIVEYKPTKPKNKDWNDEDLMQVFAQKLCVDHVFGGNCEAAIYYADVRKRIMLPLHDMYAELDRELKRTVLQMRSMLEQGRIPPIPERQYCSGCSMKDICLPVKKTGTKLRNRIMAMAEDDEI